jgi:hypothetical protein
MPGQCFNLQEAARCRATPNVCGSLFIARKALRRIFVEPLNLVEAVIAFAQAPAFCSPKAPRSLS